MTSQVRREVKAVLRKQAKKNLMHNCIAINAKSVNAEIERLINSPALKGWIDIFNNPKNDVSELSWLAAKVI